MKDSRSGIKSPTNMCFQVHSYLLPLSHTDANLKSILINSDARNRSDTETRVRHSDINLRLEAEVWGCEAVGLAETGTASVACRGVHQFYKNTIVFDCTVYKQQWLVLIQDNISEITQINYVLVQAINYSLFFVLMFITYCFVYTALFG